MEMRVSFAEFDCGLWIQNETGAMVTIKSGAFFVLSRLESLKMAAVIETIAS